MIENNILCNPNLFDGSGRTGPISLAGKARATGQAFLCLGHPWHHKHLRDPCSLIRTFSGSSSVYVNPLCPLSPC